MVNLGRTLRVRGLKRRKQKRVRRSLPSHPAGAWIETTQTPMTYPLIMSHPGCVD